MHFSTHLFLFDELPANALTTSHDWGLVILSLAVAFLASLTALDLTSRIASVRGTPAARRMLTLGAFSLGCGIWAMHFVGMMAMKMAAPVLYEPLTTLLSVLAAILSAYLALRLASSATFSRRHLILGSILMGSGIGAMHYIGMDAMRMPASLHYRLDYFLLSIIVAVATSAIALSLTFHIGQKAEIPRISTKYLSAAFMGGGICGLHYTAMAAAVFVPLTGTHSPPVGWDAGFFTLAIGLVILGIVIGYHWELNLSEIRVKKNADSLAHAQQIAHMGNWDWDIASNEIIWSKQIFRIFGMEPEVDALSLSGFLEIVHPDDRERVQEAVQKSLNDVDTKYDIQHRIIRPDGSQRVVHEIGQVNRDANGKPLQMSGTVSDITEFHELEKREARALQSRVSISALLETGLEPLSLEKQLQVALDIILSVPWLSVQYKGSIFLMDEESGELVLHANKGLAAGLLISCARIKPGYCLCGRAAQSRKILFSSHLDHRHDIHYDGIQPHGHYCVPILAKDRVRGVLNLYLPEGHPNNPEEDAFLTAVANTLAGLIDLRQTEAKLRAEQEFSATILRTAPALVVVLDQEGHIILFNEACQQLTGYSEQEALGRFVWDFLLPPPQIAQVQEVFQSLTIGHFPHVHENHWVRKDGSTRLISWYNSATLNSDGTIHHIIGTGLDITEKRQAEERLQYMASHDALTGLPNRMQFIEHLSVSIAQAKRGKEMLGILFMDLDRFKAVNDNLGHDIGDLLLIAVAERIKECLRESDVVARLGGDEFTVIMNGFSDLETVVPVVHKIIEALSTPFHLEGHACHIGTSIGVSLFPDHGENPQELLKKADLAMYQVKNRGRNDFQIFQAEASVPE
ncbi:MAG: diguanylate cyclase [Magnetococcales bacterium]|nr:diguanylate cyclase [Magnetococcales bacterium]